MNATTHNLDAMMTIDDRLTVTQVDAARIAGVSDRTFRRWEARGQIIGKRIGGVKLYPVADLKRLVGVR